jgi:hypothetical protein
LIIHVRYVMAGKSDEVRILARAVGKDTPFGRNKRLMRESPWMSRLFPDQLFVHANRVDISRGREAFMRAAWTFREVTKSSRGQHGRFAKPQSPHAGSMDVSPSHKVLARAA